MTKLVVVLAVVVVVILVVVIVAVRNMRTEDPDELADVRDDRGRAHGNQDDRDLGYHRESAGRQPARAGRGARPAGGPASGRQGNGFQPTRNSREADERRDQPPAPYGRPQDAQNGQGYGADQGFDQRDGRPYDDRRGAPAASGPQKRRRPDSGTQHRPDDAPAPYRSRRRSGDSAEWDSSEWEKLSDIDYWAELAAQKPLTTTTAQPAPPRPAAPPNGVPAGPGQDLEPETMAARNAVPGGVPRRDPVTGLPVRGPQPADAGLAATAGRSDFVPAPVDGAGPLDHQLPPAAPNGNRGSHHHHRRPAASRNGERASRQQPPAAPESQPGQRFLDAPGRDPGGYLDVGPASLPMPAVRDAPPARRERPRDIPPAAPAAAAPPAPAPPARRERPRPLDDDPLTSPSFPKIPASDSRSYRNGRSDTPPGGSRVPAQYPAATPQFPGYDASAAQYPTAQYPTAQPAEPQYPTAQYPTAQPAEPQYPAAQYPTAQPAEPQYPAAQYPAPYPATAQYPTAQAPAQRSGQHSAPQDSAPQRPAPDPLASRSPYPAQAANGSSGRASTPPGRGPATPAAGNPYGSYVTPDSQQTEASGYNGYPATPGNGNGHGLPYPPPAAPGSTGQNGNGYWHQSAPVSGSPPEPGGPGYLQDPAQAGNPRPADVQEPDYRNGYGRHGQAGYPRGGYPAAPEDPAGYTPVDPYGSDGYGGYPEYGAAGR